MTLDLAAAIANHHRFFHGTQTITLTKADDSATDSVNYVSSFPLTKKQAALMAGLGIEDEARSFSFPAAEIASGYEPSNGMKFVDAASQEWRIVTVEMKTLEKRFLVTAVKTRAAFIQLPAIVAGASATVEELNPITGLSATDSTGGSLYCEAEIVSADLTLAESPGPFYWTQATPTKLTLTSDLSTLNVALARIGTEQSGTGTLTLRINPDGAASFSDTADVAITAKPVAPLVAITDNNDGTADAVMTDSAVAGDDFEIRHRINGGAWVNDDSGSLPFAGSYAFTGLLDGQLLEVQSRVRGNGVWSDWGSDSVTISI